MAEVTDEQLAEWESIAPKVEADDQSWTEQGVALDAFPKLVRALRDARARIAERATLDAQLCTRSLLEQVEAERDALRQLLDRVSQALAVDEQAAVKVAAAQQLLIDAGLPEPRCGCRRCDDAYRETLPSWLERVCRPFIVCSECGNKRCPHAAWHGNVCTGSNEPGQPGSDYPVADGQEQQ